MTRPIPAPALALEPLRSEVEAIVARHAGRTSSYRTAVPGLHVARVVKPVPATPHLSEASVCFCIRGAREVTLGDTVYRHEESRFLISAVGRPVIVAIDDASPEKPYTALRIDLDLDLARQVMAEVDLHGIAAGPPDASLSFGMLDRDLLDAVARLVRLIEAPGDVPFLAGLVHREILYRLLSGQAGRSLRQIARLGSQGHRVARAVDWLRTNFRERLTIDELAHVAGMGVSTLHRHFHELTGMSPVQYQKRLRLHEARRRLLEEDTDVGSAALSVGYESPTQFIREYRRLFGEPPLRDIRALRRRTGGQEVI